MFNKKEKTNKAVALAGIVAAVLLLVAFDLSSTGIADKGEREALARSTATRWVGENSAPVFKAAQSALFGTGVWLKGLSADNYKLGEVTEADESHLLICNFDIEHDKVDGALVVAVDMRISSVAGVPPTVARVTLEGIAPKGKENGEVELVFEGGAYMRGRAGYYLTACSSLIWHLLVAGMLFGAVRFALGRLGMANGPGPAMVASVALSIMVVALASGLSPKWLAGSAAMAVLFVAWKLASPAPEPSQIPG